MKNLLKIMLNGAYDNFKRIFFASDRVTDMDMRNAILTGQVKPEEKVDSGSCIGCGGCANVCPTNAIVMKPLQSIEEITDGWVKKEVPELDPEKCVVCYWCHDFCPIYSLYGETGTIHPNAVGDIDVDVKELMNEPIKISDDKITFISQYLTDKTVLDKKHIIGTDVVENEKKDVIVENNNENITGEKNSKGGE